jgi:phosphoserine phosphatase RsbU/P
MKVLVVDDDPAAQRILKLFLERSGYEPLVLSDGSKVLDLVNNAEAPPIIILDWLMPGVDGLEVLKRLRGAKLKDRPYVLMLSSKSSKEDIAAGLDAGADDFVSKPFNVAEMQARLRVACRTYQYQRELQRQIEENELLKQRNNLLSEFISPGGDMVTAAEAELAAAIESAKKDASGLVRHDDQEIRFLMSATLMELRLVLEAFYPQEKRPEIEPGSCCAWATLLDATTNSWMELMVVTHFDVAKKLFEKSLRRKPSGESEMLTLWSELGRRVSQGFTRNLQARGHIVIVPLMPRSQSLGIWRALPPLPPDCRSFTCMVDGQPITLFLGQSTGAKLSVLPSQLQELDVLSEPYPIRSASTVSLFNEGIVLTPRFIDRIAQHSEQTRYRESITVFRPTGLARYFTKVG